jgi:serine/threonine-protein kinase
MNARTEWSVPSAADWQLVARGMLGRRAVTQVDSTSARVPGRENVSREPRPGDVIQGKYTLLYRIADGAMGSVWGALHKKLDLPVAIKIVHPHAKYPSVAPSLLWEGQAAARVSHPAIVRIFDYDETERGEAFIVMEQLVGDTLRLLLERERKLPPERALRLFLPLADGLAAMHERGIVHRDLKPENVVLSRQDAGRIQPKIVDFGVARLSWLGDGWASAATVVGTPGYMAPEQMWGDLVDARADVWAFSAMLYEALSGELPFPADDIDGAHRALEANAAPSLAARAGTDGALAAVVERGLRKRADERWPSFEDVGDALARWLLERGVREDVSGTSLELRWLRVAPEIRFQDPTSPSFVPMHGVLPLVRRKTARARPTNRRRTSDGAESPPVLGRTNGGEPEFDGCAQEAARERDGSVASSARPWWSRALRVAAGTVAIGVAVYAAGAEDAGRPAAAHGHGTRSRAANAEEAASPVPDATARRPERCEASRRPDGSGRGSAPQVSLADGVDPCASEPTGEQARDVLHGLDGAGTP